MEDATGGEIRKTPSGGTAAAISTGLVQLHRRYYGKGPTKAKTYFLDETVVCILRGGFTTVERTLIDSGKTDAVHGIRQSFQDTMKGPFVEVVEQATGRKVTAYMSQIHSDPDVAVEIFMLEPLDAAQAPSPQAEQDGEPG